MLYEGISRFTNYKSDCINNRRIQEKYSVFNPNEYRMFLQKNAMYLANENLNKVYKKVDSCKCKRCQQTRIGAGF